MSKHPEISFSNIKEPRYFSSHKLILPQMGPGDQSVDKKLITSFSSYRSLYSKISNKRVGDASSEYLYSYKTSIPEIKKKLGDIPIIIMLRSPVERSYSAYNNLVRDNREKLSFEEALLAENTRIQKRYDMMWHYKSVSFYYKQVKAFISNFSDVKVLIFEDFIKNPKLILDDVFDFLKVSKLDFIDTSIKYSKSGVPKNKIISIVLGRNNFFSSFIRSSLLKILGRSILEKISPLFLKKYKDLDHETKEKLLESFKDDIQNLQSLINKDLKSWRKI